jgi:hypothetical protein
MLRRALIAGTLLLAFVLVAVLAHRRPAASAPPPATHPAARAPAPPPAAPPATPPAARRAPAPPAAAAPAPVTVAVRAAWGAGPADLGRSRPAEGAPAGPMSLAVDGSGSVYVLDQVNARVQVFAAGRALRQIPLPGDTFQDLALGRDGLVLLDRLARRALTFVDERGTVRHEVALEGAGVPEGGGVTGLFVRDDGAWVEVEHRGLVRVADAAGRADPARPTQPGRLAADGRAYLRAVRAAPDAALVLAAPAAGAGELALLAQPTFAWPVQRLSALESDRAGRVYLGAVVADQATGDEREVVVVLAPGGAEAARLTLPPRPGPEEQLRPLVLGADGAIYQLACEPDAAVIRRAVP